MATGTFTVDGAPVDAKQIDAKSDFVLAAGAAMENGTAILAHERPRGDTPLTAVTVDGEIRTLTPAELDAALKAQAQP
jgi:hypothetical protein